ncbi:hypothetical protein JZU61_04210 [bacterium]|nr:hypothetical protein [bacterium]MBV5348844.1 hypothetical protein [bacterium]
MNYIELINDFWKHHAEEQFSPVEGMMYFHLLDVSNRLGWKNPFKQANQRIASVLGVTEKTIQAARKHLESSGLIQYKHGDGRRYVSTYTLLSLEISDSLKGEETLPEKVEKNDPLIPEKGTRKVEIKDPLIIENVDEEEKKGTQKVEKKDGFTTINIKLNNTEKNIGKKTIFSPPSLPEIESYFSEKIIEKRKFLNPNSEAEKFEAFYSSKNWMVGKNKMADWRKAVSGWIARSTVMVPATPQHNNYEPIKERVL